MADKIGNYYTGTSGIILPVPNKEFYPITFQNKSRLCYLSSLVNSIEVNSSFYKIPMSSTVARWATEVSADFRFTFKLFKEITHNNKLSFDPQMVDKFMKIISNVGHKKGCLLVQFPPSITIKEYKQIDFLIKILHTNNYNNEWKIAIEFRHSSLYTDKMYELLSAYNLGMVIHDKAAANTPIINQSTNFMYLRFHGPYGNYRESYHDDILLEYATYIKEWLAEEKDVFVYFNNTMGDAYNNLIKLRKFVADD